MSRSGALDLATSVGGKIEKKEVVSAVDKYEKYHASFGGKEEERKSNYADMVNKYYDLSTSFYEFGWGESFNFASRWKGETLRESIKRHEHFIALQLGLVPGMKVLDVGCGIGGPLREIARFSLASITGLNNNEYQISRGNVLNRVNGVDKCNYVQADFMNMSFTDGTFDAAYAIAAPCHAPDAIVREMDLARNSPLPWYLPLDTTHLSLSSFRLTAVGRFLTKNMMAVIQQASKKRPSDSSTRKSPEE